MSFDFVSEINRRNTASVKWDGQEQDVLPLWVADMDFAAAPPIMEALKKRLEHPVFGYTGPGEGVYSAIIGYYRKRHHYEIKKEWIVFIPGVNTGNNIAARALGGGMMVNTPMYPHINQKLPLEAGQPITRVPLKEQESQFTFDFEAMEEAVTADITTFVLCNPHNPVGHVYTREELDSLFDFAKRHNLTVISDEIHSDLVLEGEHIPAFTLGEKARERSITHHSATKTYNIPGLPAAFAVIPNPELRARYQKAAAAMVSPFSALSFTAMEAAFTNGEPWRQALLEHLKDNRSYLDERINRIKGLHYTPGSASYLAWIDARETGLDNPWKFFLEKALVHLNDGVPFSAEGFVRLNFGCPRKTLEEACDRIERALQRR